MVRLQPQPSLMITIAMDTRLVAYLQMSVQNICIHVNFVTIWLTEF